MSNNQSYTLRTPMIRFSYPNLITPRAYQGDNGAKGKPTFNIEAILDPSDLGKFQLLDPETKQWSDCSLSDIVMRAAKDMWPDIDVKESIKHGGLSIPVADGDARNAEKERKGKAVTEAYNGMKLFKASTNEQYPPLLVVHDNGKMRSLDRNNDADMTVAKQRFSAGNYGLLNINVKAIETPQGKFVKCYLGSVLFAKEGESLGGVSLEDRFQGIEGGFGDFDPMADEDESLDDLF